jgi:hypothetical protein
MKPFVPKKLIVGADDDSTSIAERGAASKHPIIK